MLRQVLKFYDKSEKDKLKILEDLCSEVQIKDYLKAFFNIEHEESFIKKKMRDISDNETKRFLICFDYIEQLVESSEEESIEFSEFLVELLDGCPQLRILVTSEAAMKHLPYQY